MIKRHNVGDLFLYSYNINEGFRVHRLGMVAGVVDYGNNFPMYKVIWANYEQSQQTLYSYIDILLYKEGLRTYLGEQHK